MAQSMHIATPDASALTLEKLLLLEDESFVRAAYQSVLGRPVDESGLETYTGQLRRGIAKEAVLATLARSAEGRARGAAIDGLAALVGTVERQERCRLCRFLRVLLTQAFSPLLQQLRVIDNRLYRLEQSAQACAARAASAPAPLGMPKGVSVLDRPVPLGGRSAAQVVADLAERLPHTAEAAVLRAARHSTR